MDDARRIRSIESENDDHHRVAAKKVTMSSAVDRTLRCMVLFWLFVVLVLVLDRSIVGLYHFGSVDARVRCACAMRWTKGDRNHGLRDKPMN